MYELDETVADKLNEEDRTRFLYLDQEYYREGLNSRDLEEYKALLLQIKQAG